MPRVQYRPFFAAAALFMALTGGITLAVFSGGETTARASTRHTIEVDEEGFNPRQCNIVRDDEVVFKNVGDTPMRVFMPGKFGFPDDPDWTLAPGEVSGALSFTAGGNYVYHSGAGDTVTVFTPNGSTGSRSCNKEAPTPTPTPTFTATPTATPAPPRPAKCSWNGCAISLGLAYDGD